VKPLIRGIDVRAKVGYAVKSVWRIDNEISTCLCQ